MDWCPRHYYVLKHTTTNVMYIGQRIKNDVGTAYFGSGRRWVRHRRKHGWKDVSVEELHFFSLREDAQRWLDEQVVKYGEYWKDIGFANLIPETTDDYASQLGRRHSGDVRQHLSEVRKGRPQSGGVKQHSDESKQMMSSKRKGRKLAEEDRLKKSLAQKGRPKSESHIQAMRRPKRKAICINCGNEFGSHVLPRHYIKCANI